MAAERMVNNPHLEIAPDHSTPHYAQIRTILINTGLSEQEAIASLDDSWTCGHEERVQTWDQQAQEDAQEQAEQRRLAQEQEDQDRAQRELEQQNEQREIKKKKPKMNDFDKDTSISDFITPPPSAYALRRLKEFNYVELWYFTKEGCADAAQNQRTQNEDTFGLTKVNDMVSLRPIASLKASKNVLQDVELTWRQMSMAKTTLIQQITKYRWPEKSVMSIAHFFMNLEVHPYRQRPYGEQALLLYQARVRREWHDQLKQNQGFNIATINESLLQTIHREIMDRKQAESIDEVSEIRIV